MEDVEKGAVEAQIHIKIKVLMNNVGIREDNTRILRIKRRGRKRVSWKVEVEPQRIDSFWSI